MLAENCWSPACIHHSASLHFPPLLSLSGLSFSSSYQLNSKEKHTFHKHAAILCFCSLSDALHRTFLPSSFPNTTCLLHPQLGSSPFCSLAPACSGSAHPSSLRSPAAACPHWSVSPGSYQSQNTTSFSRRCVFACEESQRQGCKFLIRSNCSRLFLEVATHTAMHPPHPQTPPTPLILSIYTTHHHCQS